MNSYVTVIGGGDKPLIGVQWAYDKRYSMDCSRTYLGSLRSPNLGGSI